TAMIRSSPWCSRSIGASVTARNDRSDASGGPRFLVVGGLPVDEAVVALDYEPPRPGLGMVEQETAEGVLLWLQAQARAAGVRTSACARSPIRSSADSIPTESRIRLRGAAKGAFAVEACVIRAGCSIRLSTPPRLSASSQM